MRFEAGSARKTIIGLVHLKPLPGTPNYGHGTFRQIVAEAVASAVALRDGGADGCLVQTVDGVYRRSGPSDPARVAALAVIVAEISAATGHDLALGVQVMRNDVAASLAIASVAGAGFVRATALVGRTAAPEGVVDADPERVAAYRTRIGAQDVAIVADVATQHFSWLDGRLPVARIARLAVDAGADAVAIGDPDDAVALAAIEAVRSLHPSIAIVVAGHTTPANARRLLAAADAVLVGRCIERGGFGGRVDAALVRDYVAAARGRAR